MPSQRAHLLFLVPLLAPGGCKEPVEDQVPPVPPTPVATGARGQPPPEARAYVTQKAPPLRYAVNARFGDEIVLLGYDVPKTRFRPGEQVSVTLYWKALADVTEPWQVFMHLDPAGIDDPKYRGYGDHHPVFGLYPTLQWKAGDVIRDQVTLPLRENVRAPKADLWVGLYIDARRAKLQAGFPSDGKDRLRMVTFDVEGFGAPESKLYTVHRADGPIQIDGRFDEPSWQKLPSTGRFLRTVGGGRARLDTWAKLLWDDTSLYVAFYCADPDIRSPYKKRDEPLWQADAVEVFIDADGDGKTYVEIQVSPANVLFDSFFSEKRKGDLSYTAGIRSSVRVDGTLNQPGDRDRSWTVEMAIPLKDIRNAPRIPPKIGDTWRANLIRVERTGGDVDDSAWSPPGADYHNLGAMGKLLFADVPGKGGGLPLFLRKQDLIQRLGRTPVLERRRLPDGGPLMSIPPP
jgi:hypothetical protein